MSRSLSTKVRTAAQHRAGGRCQICGDDDFPVCCYIHSKSTKMKHVRVGSRPEKAYNNDYVRSIDNVVVLCLDCYSEVSSKKGLETFSVEYLESLNHEVDRCTILVPDGANWIRCHEKRVDPNSYRCLEHLDH